VKIIRVGDPHTKVSNLKDSQKLMDYVYALAKEHKVDRIEFMGDQFDTHAVIRIEVQDFWSENIKKFSELCRVLFLLGNHDMQGSKEKSNMNAMGPFSEWTGLTNRIWVADKDMILDGIGYISYKHTEEDFIDSAKKLYESGCTELIIAHQSFTGAQYENGFYDPYGIDPDKIPQKSIISGHIHKKQQVGKCFYVGTAKWDTISDANEEKGVHIFKHNEDGSVSSVEFFSTKEIVSPIYKFTVNEGDEEPTLVPEARNYLELCGQAAWITKLKKKYKGLAQIKARPTDRRSAKTDKSNLQSVHDFLNNCFNPTNNVSKADIETYLRTLNES